MLEHRAVGVFCFLTTQLLQVLLVDGGWRHTAATTASNFYAWGWNKWGQLGIGHKEEACVPTEVAGLQEPISHIACGWRHTLAVTATGNLLSWGRNCNGQLGAGTLEDKCVPICSSLSTKLAMLGSHFLWQYYCRATEYSCISWFAVPECRNSLH